MESLNISEIFYSIQGEGVSRGTPSVFVRSTGCSLMCGGHNGILVKQGRASWHCDSEQVWKQGEDHTYAQFLDKLRGMGQWENILRGTTHLIYTGGEPTLASTAKAFNIFTEELDKLSDKVFIELETSASVAHPEALKLIERCDQINCSPKLANSGMPKQLRINRTILNVINEHRDGWFKFVVSSKEDWEEIERDFLPLIDRDKVILMPAVDSMENMQDAFKTAWEIAMDQNVKLTGREHIVAFDTTVGV